MLAALPVAAACGFSPALAPGSGAGALQNRIAIDPPSGREGFALVERLEQRLGRASAPRYRLAWELETEVRSVGAGSGMSATRAQVTGVVDYVVTDLASGAELETGTVSAFTGWSTTSTALAGTLAEEDARTRLMNILADRMVTQLMASSAGWATPE